MRNLTKRFANGLLGVLCIVSSADVANARKLVLAYVDFPPYEFQEGGEAKGILVTFVKTVFERAEVPLELRFYPFKRAYENVKVGTLDGLFNFYKTGDRLPFFDYSEPIIDNQLVFFVQNSSKTHFNSLLDLKGLIIGVVRGYTYGEEFDKTLLFTRDPANNHLANFKKLTRGRIDAFPCDRLVGIQVATMTGIYAKLKILPVPLKEMSGHIGFSKGKHGDVIAKINPIITEMRANGEIEKITDHHIISIKQY